MSQSDNPNAEPWRIHGAEQHWAEINEHLEKIISHVQAMEPTIYERAAGNHDPSVLFDFMAGFIFRTSAANEVALNTTMLMAAAAITRLVRASRTDTNDPLAQLDWQPNTTGETES